MRSWTLQRRSKFEIEFVSSVLTLRRLPERWGHLNLTFFNLSIVKPDTAYLLAVESYRKRHQALRQPSGALAELDTRHRKVNQTQVSAQ